MSKHLALGASAPEAKNPVPLQVTYVTVWGEWFKGSEIPDVLFWLHSQNIKAKALGNTIKVPWSAREDAVGTARQSITEWRGLPHD